MATVRQSIPADSPDAKQSGPDVAARSLPAPEPPAIDKRFEALLRQVHANRSSDDVSLIRKAWEF
ncbi:MAG: hypothetical protein WAN28_18410, partial [Terracidiphilus sp.]